MTYYKPVFEDFAFPANYGRHIGFRRHIGSAMHFILLMMSEIVSTPPKTGEGALTCHFHRVMNFPAKNDRHIGFGHLAAFSANF